MSANARKDVVAQIKADNPTFTVHDYPATAPLNLANGKVWVSVYREAFEVNGNATSITHNLKALIITSKSSSTKAEDELDAAVDKLMLSLERLPDVYWQDAKRTIVAEKFDGYEITLTAVRQQIYKSQLVTN
jgi:hypothetical protein